MASPIIPGVPLRFRVVIQGEVGGMSEQQVARMLMGSITWSMGLSQYLAPAQVEIYPPDVPGGPQLVKPGGN